MDFLRFFGFFMVIAIVVAGLDYYQQDKKYDGTLSAGGYINTVKSRFALYQDELEAGKAERERQKLWRAGGKPYLPEPSEEWVRRSVMDGDYTRDAREGEAVQNRSEAARAFARDVAVRKAEDFAKKLDQVSWVYGNGDQTILMQVSLKENVSSKTLVGNIQRSFDSMNFSTKSYAPFAIVGGVAYFKLKPDKYSSFEARDRTSWSMATASVAVPGENAGFEQYKATIGLGQEIRLTLRTNAPEDSVRTFLERLDYDGLNALLSISVPGVGNDSVIAPEDQPELALKMADLRTEFLKLRGELAQLKIDNMDGIALVANTMVSQYGLPDGTFDLTGNRVTTPDDLVQVGYRKGLEELLSAAPEEEGTEGGGILGRLFAKVSGEKATTEATEQESAGMLDGLKSYFQKTDTPQKSEIRVNKGDAGSLSNCATKGAFKTCSLGGS